MECINFDGETDEGLAEHAKRLDKEIDGMMLQRRYITTTALARLNRKEGKINAAIDQEKRCDLIYKLMPEEIRW